MFKIKSLIHFLGEVTIVRNLYTDMLLRSLAS